jgi:3-isopropylmalate/(R)-2-methylmalate dehydratase small subunit
MRQVSSIVVPIPLKDIDTDQVIPAEYLKLTGKKGLGEHLFDELRKADKDFPLNQACYRQAGILVTRDNFGCGSSREHAAWALRDWGIRAIIAPSFADIFYKNALSNGIVPVPLAAEVVDKIFRLESERFPLVLTIDLAKRLVRIPDGGDHEFPLDPFHAELLIWGMDDLDYLTLKKPEIAKFEAAHSKHSFLEVSGL